MSNMQKAPNAGIQATSEHSIIADLARIAAERALVALETKARLHGMARHIFPLVGDKEPDSLTVTPMPLGFSYWMNLPPNAGPVERQMAIKMLSSDKSLRVLNETRHGAQ